MKNTNTVKAMEMMPRLLEHFRAGRLEYNMGDLKCAKDHFNVIIGMFAVHDELNHLPEATMLYRETIQLLGDTFLAEHDFDSYLRCVKLFYSI